MLHLNVPGQLSDLERRVPLLACPAVLRNLSGIGRRVSNISETEIIMTFLARVAISVLFGAVPLSCLLWYGSRKWIPKNHTPLPLSEALWKAHLLSIAICSLGGLIFLGSIRYMLELQWAAVFDLLQRNAFELVAKLIGIWLVVASTLSLFVGHKR